MSQQFFAWLLLIVGVLAFVPSLYQFLAHRNDETPDRKWGLFTYLGMGVAIMGMDLVLAPNFDSTPTILLGAELVIFLVSAHYFLPNRQDEREEGLKNTPKSEDRED